MIIGIPDVHKILFQHGQFSRSLGLKRLAAFKGEKEHPGQKNVENC
jgi:hypothetical protein